MDRVSSRFLATRVETHEHKGQIRNANGAGAEYDKIIEKVFRHQIAVYDANNALSRLSYKEEEETVLAAYFYSKCYRGATIRVGDPKGRVIREEEFMQSVLFERNGRHRNHLSYLLGDVGVGKTAFVNSLISRHGKSWFENANTWFIRVDTEIAGGGKKLTPELLVDLICRKMLDVFQSHPEVLQRPTNAASPDCLTAVADLRKATSPSFELTAQQQRGERYFKQLNALCELIKTMRDSLSKRLFLVIDNLDYLVHMHDRHIYHDDSGDISVLQAVCDTARLFLNEHPLGSLGLNVLFVMRFDTFHVVSEQGRTSLSEECVWQSMNAYTLDKPDWKSVLSSRGQLLEFAAERQNSTLQQQKYRKLISTILDDLSSPMASQARLIEHLERLTNYGLRAMMQFFGTYSWMEKDFKKHNLIMDRFVHSYPLGVITFMLNGHRRFSQMRSYFPNIYLVNSQNFEHAHSYWLKRMIIQFLYKKSETDEHISPDQVVSVFRGDNGSGYDERLIRECLGSLSEANGSNLVQFNRRRNAVNQLVIDKVGLTSRGKHCVEQIFDRFFYLQLVVEDNMLPLPECILRQFNYSTNNVDYGYIVQADLAVFKAEAKKMIELKAKQVLVFLLILRCSLEFEKARYRKVFDELEQHKVSPPNVYAIRQRIIEELDALKKCDMKIQGAEIAESLGEASVQIPNCMELLYAPQA